jgi:D-alanyl-D-alanine carboxypeptidase
MLNLRGSFGSVIFITFLAIFFCVLFLSGNPPETVASPDTIDRSGRVLGVVERFPDAPAVLEGGSDPVLPENQNIKEPVLPKLEEIAEKLVLTDCESALLLDAATGQELFSKEPDNPRSIASLTKLATALVFLDSGTRLDGYYEVKQSDIVSGGQIYLSPGDQVKRQDLLGLALVGSANSAARALAASTGFAENDFVAEMNDLASKLGLSQTEFVDPAGLYIGNVSTAREISVLLEEAMSHPEIFRMLGLEVYEFRTKGGRFVRADNTDRLLAVYPRESIDLEGGKTGFTRAAGYCFASRFTSDEGNSLISVVLGGSDLGARFSETEKMVNWAFRNYTW